MLKKEISITFAGTAVSTVLAIGTSVIMARSLGPANRGLLALALLIPSVVGMFASLGHGTVNLTFAGLYKDKRDSLFLQSMIVTVFGCIASVLAICTFYFWLPIQRGEFDKLDPPLIWLGCIVAPVSVLAVLMISLVRGVGRITSAAVIGIIQTIMTLGAALILLVWLKYGLYGAVCITAFVPLVTTAMLIWVIRDYAYLKLSVLSWSFFKKSLSFGFLNNIATLAGFLIYRLDQGILAYMVPTTQLGLYVVAVALAEKLKILPGSIGTAFLPRLANELKTRQSQVPSMFRYTTVVSILSMLVVAVIGAPAILILYGWEYLGSIAPFLILLPGVAALGGCSILASDLLTREKAKYNVVIAYAILIVCVVLNFILIPMFGIMGAALTSTISYIFAMVLRMILYRQLSGVPIQELIPRWPDVTYVWINGIAFLKQMLRWGQRKITT